MASLSLDDLIQIDVERAGGGIVSARFRKCFGISYHIAIESTITVADIRSVANECQNIASITQSKAIWIGESVVSCSRRLRTWRGRV